MADGGPVLVTVRAAVTTCVVAQARAPWPSAITASAQLVIVPGCVGRTPSCTVTDWPGATGPTFHRTLFPCIVAGGFVPISSSVGGSVSRIVTARLATEPLFMTVIWYGSGWPTIAVCGADFCMESCGA